MPKCYRSSAFSGSWYENEVPVLVSQIETWLEAATKNSDAPSAQAIIAPHAGYAYCGHVMAHAYKRVDPSQVERVFLFGPSHCHYTERCVLSSADAFCTPLGDIPIAMDIYKSLKATNLFEVMDLKTDEAEHSLELHTPYIQYILREKLYHLVPIMVGSLSVEMEGVFGRLLSQYLNDSSNLFVISSDFCHWGRRFNYTPYDSGKGPIWTYIETLDREGMSAIEKGDVAEFRKYLHRTRNTICGRYPIQLLLNMMRWSDGMFDISFLFYDQSSHCQTTADSSVSYAAGVITRRTAHPQ